MNLPVNFSGRAEISLAWWRRKTKVRKKYQWFEREPGGLDQSQMLSLSAESGFVSAHNE